jgi:four helix bundle protein
MRRAAVSVMSNVAEGFESGTRPQFVRYLEHAKGSAGELRAQLYVALDAGYISDEEFAELLELAKVCSRQLTRFIVYLKTHPQAVRESGVEYGTSA